MTDFHDMEMLKRGYWQKLQELKEHTDDLALRAEDRAQAERDYLKAIETAMVDLRLKGEPTTLIKDLARGRAAEERHKHIIAESMWSACNANIKRCHANLDAFRTLISSGKAEMNIQ